MWYLDQKPTISELYPETLLLKDICLRRRCGAERIHVKRAAVQDKTRTIYLNMTYYLSFLLHAFVCEDLCSIDFYSSFDNFF